MLISGFGFQVDIPRFRLQVLYFRFGVQVLDFRIGLVAPEARGHQAPEAGGTGSRGNWAGELGAGGTRPGAPQYQPFKLLNKNPVSKPR